MNILLDTHAYLWFIGGDERLSNVARYWYESRADGLGEDFVRMAYATFEELLEFPKKNNEVYGLFRRALMKHFPYSVYYHCSADTITIYGVFHSSRDPALITQMLGIR